jgi:hypothetical protein
MARSSVATPTDRHPTDGIASTYGMARKPTGPPDTHGTPGGVDGDGNREGTSAWELGVDKNPQRQAEEEFRKRTKAPLGLDRQKTTFVFVTPRKWPRKAEWRREKEELGPWKDVRVYDSASLEEWLEQSPAVDAWLAGILGKKPTALTTIDEYWENLRAVTEPSLNPGVFLASREEEVKKLGTGWPASRARW